MRHFIRRFAFLLACLFLLSAFPARAATDINVVQAWDGVPVANGAMFSFPPIGPGLADSRRFRIDNSGNATLTISNAASILSGTCYSLIETPASSIAAGGSTYFRVRFLCSEPGTFAGTVSITSNDPDENPFVIHLGASVVAAPHIAVVRAWDNISIPNNGSFAFPAAVPANGSDSFRFRIDNQGNATLTLTNPGGIVSGACFSLLETPAASIAPGTSTYFRVRLGCPTAGAAAGTVQIASNDTDATPYRIALSGTITPAAAPPEISVTRDWDGVAIPSGGAFAYPTIAPFQSESRLFRIHNSGGGPLAISNPASLVSGSCFSLLESPPSSIAAGTSATFRVRVQCPAAGSPTGMVTILNNDADEGSYTFALTGSVGTLGSAFVSQSVPATMIAGRTYNVSLTFRNTGTAPWTAASNIVLGAWDTNWGVQFVRLGPAESIANNQTKTFTFSVTAPGAPGLYAFHWGMSIERVSDFGPRSPSLNINVTPQVNDAAFISQDVPVMMEGGRQYEVALTFKNTGDVTWTAAGKQALGAWDTLWGVQTVRIPAGEAIAPGQTKTFRFMVTAPATASIYQFHWGMQVEGVLWFGPRSPVVNVVTGTARVPSISSVSPRNIAAGSVTTVTVTGTNLLPATVSVPATGTTTPPAVRVLSVDGAGTSMQVQVDARSGATEAIHALIAANSAGRGADYIRITPTTPVIDAYTPSEGVGGNTYAFAAFGVNLSNATVTALSGGVTVTDVRRTDTTIVGLLHVPPGAPSLPVHVEVRNPNGAALLPVQIGGTSKATSAVTSGDGAGGIIHVQEAVEGGGLPRLPPNVVPGGAVCTFRVEHKSQYNETLLWLSDPVTNTPLASVLEGLDINVPKAALFRALLFYGELQQRIELDILCSTGSLVGARLCLKLDISAEAPGAAGVRLVANGCLGSGGEPDRVEISSSGIFDFHYCWGDCSQPATAGSCGEVIPVDDSNLSRQDVNILLRDCCSETLNAFMSGVRSDGKPFSDQKPLVRVQPKPQCARPPYTVTVRAFIPVNHIPDPTLQFCDANPLPILIDRQSIIHRGDFRGFDADPGPLGYRMRQTISSTAATGISDAGMSKAYADDALDITAEDQTGLVTDRDDDATLNDCHLLVGKGRAQLSVKEAVNMTEPGSPVLKFHFEAAGEDPLIPLPSAVVANINWELDVEIDTTGERPTWRVTGQHDCYPAYEVFINDQLAYGFMPKGAHAGGVTNGALVLVTCLGAPMERNVQCSNVLGGPPCIKDDNQ